MGNNAFKPPASQPEDSAHPKETEGTGAGLSRRSLISLAALFPVTAAAIPIVLSEKAQASSAASGTTPQPAGDTAKFIERVRSASRLQLPQGVNLEALSNEDVLRVADLLTKGIPLTRSAHVGIPGSPTSPMEALLAPECGPEPFTCDTGFLCVGAWDDDFECTQSFSCNSAAPNKFDCEYSFDSSDCPTAFACVGGFVADGHTDRKGNTCHTDFTCPASYTGYITPRTRPGLAHSGPLTPLKTILSL